MNIRRIAAEQLAQVIGAGKSLSDHPALAKCSAADRAWCHAAVYGVLRRYYCLSACLSQLLQKPLKAKEAQVQAFLLLGLYQLHFMRVPAHAAIAETVEAVKGLRKPWAVGLVNAVLRRFQRTAEALMAALPEHARHSHAPWLFQHIQQDWPEQATDILTQNLQQPPLHLCINTQKNSRAAYQDLLKSRGIKSELSTFSPDGITLQQAVDVPSLPRFSDGYCLVQDVAAQQAAQLLAVEPGMLVLDACTAPGGKLCHLLTQVPDAQVLGLDHDAKRLTQVKQNLTRLGLKAELRCADAGQNDWWSGEPFARILLDAPCSATGVIRRHPDIQLLRQPGDIVALSEMQYTMLANLWTMLAPGGRLLYATCSILRQENDQAIQRFLQTHNDAHCVDLALNGGVPTTYGYQFLPTEQGPDGFFYSLLQRLT